MATCRETVEVISYTGWMPNTTTQYGHHRGDLAMEAIVHAAVKLMPKLGYDATFEFLIEAEVPTEVAQRVLNGGPMRARTAAST